MTPFELQKTLDSMVLLVDSREHSTEEARRRWEGFGVPYEIEALKSGDYSAKFTLPNQEIVDFRDKVVIERKMSLDEICGNFTKNRERFINEFKRLKTAEAKTYIIIEGGSWEAVLGGKYRSKIHPNALMANLTAWMARYNACILFCKAETFPRLAKEILYREAKEYLQDMEMDNTHTKGEDD